MICAVRWRCFWLMREEKRIPEAPRYAYAEKTARRFLLEAGPESFPFSAEDMLERIPCGVVCLRHSEAARVLGTEDPLHLRALGADARTLRPRSGGPYLTVFEDERVRSRERIRFSLMHELGHIVLGHLTDFEETALCRGGGLTDAQTRVLEKEADAFAGELLAPVAFFRYTNVTREMLMLLCGLSGAAADTRLSRFAALRGETEGEDDEELRHLLLPLYEKRHEVILREMSGRADASAGEGLLRVCEKCGAVTGEREALYCSSCGSRLRENRLREPARPLLPRRLCFCPRCGNGEIGEKDEYCFVCGAALRNRCPRDGRRLPENARFCSRCGSPARMCDSLQEMEDKIKKLSAFGPNETWQPYPGESYVKDAAFRLGDRALYTALCFSRLFVNDGNDLLALTVYAGMRRELIRSSGRLLEIANRFEKEHRHLGVYRIDL